MQIVISTMALNGLLHAAANGSDIAAIMATLEASAYPVEVTTLPDRCNVEPCELAQGHDGQHVATRADVDLTPQDGCCPCRRPWCAGDCAMQRPQAV